MLYIQFIDLLLHFLNAYTKDADEDGKTVLLLRFLAKPKGNYQMTRRKQVTLTERVEMLERQLFEIRSELKLLSRYEEWHTPDERWRLRRVVDIMMRDDFRP